MAANEHIDHTSSLLPADSSLDFRSETGFTSDAPEEQRRNDARSSSGLLRKLLQFAPLLVVAFIIGYIFTHPAQTKHFLFLVMEYVDKHKVPGSIIFIIFFALATCLIIPATPLTIAAGIVFRPLWLCILIILIGFQVGLVMSFTAGRTWLRPWVESKAKGDVRFIAVDRAVAKEGFRIVVLLRLSPIIPFGLNNYILSMTSIPFPKLMLATFLGNIPGTALYSFMGSVIGSLADEYEVDPRVKWITILFSLVFLTGSVVYITLVAKRALRQALVNPHDSGTSPLLGDDFSSNPHIDEETELDEDFEVGISSNSSPRPLRARTNTSTPDTYINVNSDDLEGGEISDLESAQSSSRVKLNEDTGFSPDEKRVLWWTTVGLAFALISGLSLIFLLT